MLALAVMIPAIGLAGADKDADKGTETVNDNRLLSHLYGLSQNGTFTSNGNGVTHDFLTTLGEDEWYSTTITTTTDVKSEAVSFSFKHDTTENAYLLQVDDPDIDVKIPIPNTKSHWQSPPSTIPKIVSDSDSSSPTNLYDQETQWCVAWTDSWTVESSVSNYIGKVLIEWDQLAQK